MRLHAENPHRQPAHGAGDAVTVEVEGIEIGRADRWSDVHGHAVDDGEEVVVREMEIGHRLGEELNAGARLARVEGAQIRAPDVQRRELLVGLSARLVGDVVDGAAEAVDGEHGLAFALRQDAQGGVERTSRDLGLEILGGIRVGAIHSIDAMPEGGGPAESSGATPAS